MIAFHVNDMTCGHCVSTITKAVKATDTGAKVTIDLDRRLVMVEPTASDAQMLGDAITEAGYTPVPVAAEPAGPAAARGGSCCGHCH